MSKYAYLIIGLCVGVVLGFTGGRTTCIRTDRKGADTYQRAQLGDPVDVVAAAEEIPAGTVLQPQLLGMIRISTSGNAVSPKDASLILGRRTLFSIKARQPIMWADIEEGTVASNQPPRVN